MDAKQTVDVKENVTEAAAVLYLAAAVPAALLFGFFCCFPAAVILDGDGIIPMDAAAAAITAVCGLSFYSSAVAVLTSKHTKRKNRG